MDQSFPLDGIIINSNENYHNQLIFKWKPVNTLTIDFFVQEVKPNVLGLREPEEDHIYFGLFCAVSKNDFERL
jgi:hypothetical protein